MQIDIRRHSHFCFQGVFLTGRLERLYQLFGKEVFQDICTLVAFFCTLQQERTPCSTLLTQRDLIQGLTYFHW